MSCKVLKFSGCEIVGTSFEGRTLKINGGTITSAKAVVKTCFNQTIKELQGELLEGVISFSFKEIESMAVGNYIIEYWADIETIGTEVIAVEDFKIVNANNACGCSENNDVIGDIVFNKTEIAVDLIKNIIGEKSKIKRLILKRDVLVNGEPQEIEEFGFTLQKDKVYRLKTLIDVNIKGIMAYYGGLYSEDITESVIINSDFFGNVFHITPIGVENHSFSYFQENYRPNCEGIVSVDKDINVKAIFNVNNLQSNKYEILLKKGSFIEIEEIDV